MPRQTSAVFSFTADRKTAGAGQSAPSFGSIRWSNIRYNPSSKRTRHLAFSTTTIITINIKINNTFRGGEGGPGTNIVITFIIIVIIIIIIIIIIITIIIILLS